MKWFSPEAGVGVLHRPDGNDVFFRYEPTDEQAPDIPSEGHEVELDRIDEWPSHAMLQLESGMIGIADGQTARINVVNVDALGMLRRGCLSPRGTIANGYSPCTNWSRTSGSSPPAGMAQQEPDHPPGNS